jgi:hypothetical protein
MHTIIYMMHIHLSVLLHNNLRRLQQQLNLTCLLQYKEDESMVSFEFTALFPNVPIAANILLLKKWLKQHVIIIKTVNSYVELVKLCMNDNYFLAASIKKHLVRAWAMHCLLSWRTSHGRI